MRWISPSPWKAGRALDLTLPLGGSRGTSGEGLIFPRNRSRSILQQRTLLFRPPRFVVPPQRPSLWEGEKTDTTFRFGG